MHVEKPYITVVIPLYNKENYIQNTLKSVLNQRFKNFELIIINDGSTDSSLEKLSIFNDGRIRVISTKNQGVSKARNLGIELAKASLIAFLDADDLWLENHLDQLVSLNKSYPNCGIYSNAYIKKHKDSVLPMDFDNSYSGIILDYFESSCVDSIASASSIMISKRVFDKIGTFNESITHTEDIDLWIRIALEFPIAFNGKPTVIYQLDTLKNTSKIAMKKRSYLDLDKYYQKSNNHKSLKKYLDLNAYAIGIAYKIAGYKRTSKQYFNKIDSSSLNKKQLFLMNRSEKTLRKLFRIKKFLLRLGITTSSYT